MSAALKELHDAVTQLAGASADIDKLQDQLFSAIERLSHLSSDETWDGLRWLDVNPRSLRLNLTPLDVAENLGGMINTGVQAWVFELLAVCRAIERT